MKHTLFILAIITASIQTFAQSPRIKLNQITKDSLTGSVLISSPIDSGMVYSRDLFISYGADTVLILGADTLAATSSIISSVLSDGVTITGDGTTGSELTVDTATVIATKQDLDLKQDQLNGTGFVKASGTTISYDNSTYLTSEVDGSVTNEGSLTVGAGGANDAVVSSNTSGSSDVTISGGTNVTVTESGQTITIASSGGAIPVDTFVTIAGTETITGAKTFNTAIVVNEDGNNVDTRFEGDTDANLLFLDANTNSVGIGTNTPSNKLHIYATDGLSYLRFTSNVATTGARIGYNSDVFRIDQQQNSDIELRTNNAERIRIKANGDVGIGTTSPGEKLEVNGKVKISDLTGTGGNAVYENGGVLGVASDATFKNYLGDIDNGIQKILNLKPKYFIDNRNSAFQQLGFYAQEVKSVINEASYPIGNTDYLGINDRAIIAVTVKAIQEQQAIIESQASEIEQLKTLITELSNRLQILENN